MLRTHIQHCANANFIFAGSERHLMSEMFMDTARPFYNSADMMMLYSISEDNYADFVKRHFAKADIQVGDETIHVVYQAFEGNTYYLQKTFHDLYAELGAGFVYRV